MMRRGAIFTAVLAGLLGLTALWSYQYMASQRAAALAARADLAACRRGAARIAAFRQRPAMAADREQLLSETTSLIEQAAAAAGIPPDKLIRIVPEGPQQLGKTPYKEKPTQITLRGVSLEQLVKFVHPLTGGERGLHAKALRITSHDQGDSAGPWSADLVVSYLIYEPRRPDE